MTPGYKTKSFWLTLAITLVGAFTASGVVASDSGVAQGGALVFSALAAMGYTAIRAFAKSADGEKPAYKKTEFWLSMATVAVSALLGAGVFSAESGAAQALGLVAAALAALGYGAAAKYGAAKGGA
jgi:hypothetical protein